MNMINVLSGSLADASQSMPQTPTHHESVNNEFSTPSNVTTTRRTRVSLEHMFFGKVEGAKRGNLPYGMSSQITISYGVAKVSSADIVRPRGLPPVISDSRVAGARFHRLVRDLISRVSLIVQIILRTQHHLIGICDLGGAYLGLDKLLVVYWCTTYERYIWPSQLRIPPLTSRRKTRARVDSESIQQIGGCTLGVAS